MGLLNELTGGIYGVSRLGSLVGDCGVATYPSQLAAAMQQQQAMFDPFGFQVQQAMQAQQQQMPYGYGSFFSQTGKKYVESREVTLMGDARKLINGAVQEVKDAQEKVK